MTPQSGDIEVRSLGLCNICGQEKLYRVIAEAGTVHMLSVMVKQFTDCACGLVEVKEEEARPTTE